MKDNKGITLTTLIIYVIGITLLIGIMTTITRYIFVNISAANSNSQNLNEYIKFNMHFLEDVKEKSNSVYQVETNRIIFSNGNNYTFRDGGIYKNNIKICSNVTQTQFSVAIDPTTTNQIITISFNIGEPPGFTKITEYTVLND